MVRNLLYYAFTSIENANAALLIPLCVLRREGKYKKEGILVVVPRSSGKANRKTFCRARTIRKWKRKSLLSALRPNAHALFILAWH